MTRLSSTIVLILLLISPLLVGQTRNDFARGFTVEPEGEGPLWELRLPEDVYRTVTRPDLGDLRVFNRDGAMVPHTVRRAAPLQVEAPAPQVLSFFPLRGQADEGVPGRSLRIITDAQGAIINAISEDLAADEADRVAAYLVDVSALEEMPNRLELDWEGGAAGGFAATVDVESSNDLSAWRSVASGVTLADLRSGDAVLVHRNIDLPPLEARYLRLEWPNSLQEVRLTGIQAFFRAQAQPPTRETTLITGDPSNDAPTAYEFDTGGVRPVDQVRVVFQERNAVLDAVLLSRRAPDQDWRRRHAATFYSLERDGTQVQSEPADLAPTSDRYWRMEIEGRQDGAGSPPSLEIGFRMGGGRSPPASCEAASDIALARGRWCIHRPSEVARS